MRGWEGLYGRPIGINLTKSPSTVRRGEGGRCGVGRAFMVARGVVGFPQGLSKMNRDAGDHWHLSVLPTLLRS